MVAYSMDLRVRVLALVDEGFLSRKEIAETLKVSESWIRRLVQRRRETGRITPVRNTRTGPKAKLQGEALERLRQLVEEDNDATIAELRERLAAGVSEATVGRALLKLGLTRKKDLASRRARSARGASST